MRERKARTTKEKRRGWWQSLYLKNKLCKSPSANVQKGRKAILEKS